MVRNSELSGEALKELADAILGAFPTRSELTRVVSYALDQNLEAITSPGTLQNVVFELIVWAESTGRLDALRVALRTGVSAFDDILDSGTAKPRSNPSPAALLDARYRYIPFFEHGRTDLLHGLRAWCDVDKRVRVRLFHGAGGTGKTRLFIEWCERLREQGWTAGFLFKQMDPDRFEALLASPRPTLVVVDYAESRPRLGALLEAAARWRSGRRAPLRIVLLARAIGDWWSDLCFADAPVRELVSDDAPVELVPFSELGPGRTDLFREAVARLAVAWERPAPTTPPPPLDDPLYGRVLYLHMAALAWLDGVSVAANELLAGVLDHEERFWFEQAALRSLNDRERRLLRARIRRSIMALTLLGGVAGRDQAAALLHRLDGQTDEVVLLLLHDLYSGRCLSSGRLAFIGALEPDLLGEAMVRRALLGEGDGARDVLDRVFAGADERAVRVGLEVLGRLSIEHADEARQWIGDVIAVNVGGRAVAALEAAKSVGELTAHSALGLQLALALELRGDLPLAFRLEEAGIPDVTVSLREVAAWVLSTKVNALSGAKDPWSRATRAQMLNDLGVRQQALGRHREASASMQKAERLFRDLSKTHPEHRQRLALTLRNRVGTQIHAGAHDAALRSAKEAVEIYRGLVAARPEEHQEELAAGLNNLALAQGELGQLWAALDSMKEASDIYRALSAQASERDLRPVLAQLLSNLGKAQSELGEQEAALSSTREAVTLRRALVVIQPDAFLPDLVQGLINLGKMLLALGRSEEARESTREAIANLRRLAGARPDVFLQNLALSLNNLGQMERALGRDEAACEPIEEAVIIYRRLARERPSVALAELGMCLTNLGHVHYTFGRWELATAAATESVECYRAANKEHPSIHRAALALSLNNLSHMRSAVGDHHGALASAEEAMAHYAALDAAEPGAFRPALGLSLTSVAKARRLTGDVQGSLEPARAAVANYTAHVEAYPGTFQSELALSLNTLGNVQSTIGEHADAVRSIEAALDLMRPLFEQRPEAIERQLVGTLQDLNSALIALERWHEALPTTQESISRSRALARRWPGESALNLATSLRDYSLVLQRLDRPQEGLIALQEALEMISPFVKKESERFGPIASRLTESLRLCRLALGPSGGSSEG